MYCGERTAQGLTRLDGVLVRLVVGSSFDNVVILIKGTNDISRRVGYETSAFNVREMARKVVDAGATPLISSVIPRGPDNGVDENNGKTRTYSLVLEDKASDLGVPYVDPFAVFFARPNFFETYYSDQLHPNPSGYSLLAHVFAPAAYDAFDFVPLLICTQSREACLPGTTTLCLNDGRFRVEVTWETLNGEQGPGNAVTDTVADTCKQYLNPNGTQSSVGDTAAFLEANTG